MAALVVKRTRTLKSDGATSAQGALSRWKEKPLKRQNYRCPGPGTFTFFCNEVLCALVDWRDPKLSDWLPSPGTRCVL